MFHATAVNGTLDILANLIDWNNVELFEPIRGFLDMFLNEEGTKLSAIQCIFSLIDKGMEGKVRIEQIKKLKFLEKISNVDFDDLEMSRGVASIVNKLGNSLLYQIEESA